MSGAASAQQRPSPNTALEAELYGVSCASAAACIGVGDEETGAGATVALAERWNGTAWAIQSTPDPAGAADSYLLGVSCASASACTATGYALNSTYTTLAEGWNGTTWVIRTTPGP